MTTIPCLRCGKNPPARINGYYAHCPSCRDEVAGQRPPSPVFQPLESLDALRVRCAAIRAHVEKEAVEKAGAQIILAAQSRREVLRAVSQIGRGPWIVVQPLEPLWLA